MVSEHIVAQQLVDVLPPVRRARDYWLYTDSGRYLDMYLSEGRALFGHRPPRLGHIIKNWISKGLYSPYPHVLSHRVIQHIRHNYASYAHIAIFASRTRALHALSRITQRNLTVSDIYDPALPPERVPPVLQPSIGFSRPLLALPTTDIVLPVTALPLSDAPQIVCAPQLWSEALLGDPISPVLLIAIQHSISLETLQHSQKIQEKLAGGHRSDWVEPAMLLRRTIKRRKWRWWHLQGTYLSWQGTSQHYKKLFNHLLKAQVLINPLPDGITTLPLICARSDYLRFERSHSIIEDR